MHSDLGFLSLLVEMQICHRSGNRVLGWTLTLPHVSVNQLKCRNLLAERSRRLPSENNAGKNRSEKGRMQQTNIFVLINWMRIESLGLDRKKKVCNALVKRCLEHILSKICNFRAFVFGRSEPFSFSGRSMSRRERVVLSAVRRPRHHVKSYTGQTPNEERE